MRRKQFFILFLLCLSGVSGWLLSRMSWIGRVGVDWFHREYQFLKVWYQGAGVVFAVLLLCFLLQGWVQRRIRRGGARLVQLLCLVLAGLGLYATYRDFRTDITHSILRERFHLGAYLFWIGWMSISLFYLSGERPDQSLSDTEVKRG